MALTFFSMLAVAVDRTDMTGQIPSEFGNLVNLVYMDLEGEWTLE